MLECSDIDISSDEDTEEFKETEEEGQEDVPQNEEEEGYTSSDEPLSEIQKRISAEKNKGQKHIFWNKMGQFIPPNIPFSSNPDPSARHEWTPKDYVSMYLDDSDFTNICNCTNIRYFSEKQKNLNLTVDETKTFFGISVLMSCLKYPQIKMYWAKMTKVLSISSAMTRDRYFQIRSNLKVVIDNEISEEQKKADRLFKVRPLIDRILKGCHALPRYPDVAIDEQMIPFSGVCTMKQFVRGKPNPEGLKNFVCATPKGLVLDFDIYQGKNTFLGNKRQNLGVGPSAVVKLSETLSEGTHIYVDRYFTTMGLLEHMLDKNMLVTGTIMKSRLPKSINLTSEKTMSRLGRGSSEQDVRSDNKINVVQWYDMKSVLLTSTALQIEPSDTCKRWSKKDSKYIQISRPNIVKKYNECMGGIDLIDRMISYYRMGAKTKKWTVKTIFHLFDLAIANSWILYRQDKKALGYQEKDILKYVDFKIIIAEHFIQRQVSNENIFPSMCTRNSSSTGKCSPQVSTPKKRKIEHLPIMDSSQKNSVRCKNSKCNGKTKVFCESCRMHFCLTGNKNCYKEFHHK